MAFPRSLGGYTEVIIAIPVPNTMALPRPWTARSEMSTAPDGDSAQRMELVAIIMLPIKNILFLPLISASLPRGTRNTADESMKAMETQLIPTAPSENSSLMAGKAILIAAPRKGLINDEMMIEKRINLLEFLLRSVIRSIQD